MGDLDRRVALGVDLDVDNVAAGGDKYIKIVKGMAAAGEQVGKAIATGAAAAAPAIERLGGAVKKVGDAGAGAAAGLGAAFKPAEVDVGRLVNTIQQLEKQYARTGQLSAAALAPLSMQLREINAQFAGTVEGTASLSKTQQNLLQTAQGYFDTHIANLKKYNEELKRIREQTRIVAAAPPPPPPPPVLPPPPVVNPAPALSPAFQKLSNQIDTVNRGLTQTGLIGPRNLAALGLQVKALEDQFGRTARAQDRLTASERAFLTTAQNTYRQAIAGQREFNDQLERVSRSTRNWTSLEGSLISLGGTIGKLTTAAVGFWAAWEAGTRIGAKINDFVEVVAPGFAAMRDKFQDRLVDMMSSWDRFLAYLKKRQPELPSTFELRAPIGPRGEETLFKTTLEQAQTFVGLKSLAELNAELEKFNNKVAVSQLAGKSLGSVFEESKGQVEGLVAGFRSYGQTVPVLEAVVRGWEKIKEAQEAQRKAEQEALSASKKNLEDLAKRALELEKALHGGGGVANVFDMRTKPFGQPSLELQKQVSDQQARDADANRRADGAAATKRAEEWKRVNEEINKRWEETIDRFASEMADVFTAGVTGGAEGFASAASQLFLKGVNDGAKGIFKSLAQIAFGAPPDRKDFQTGTKDEQDAAYMEAVQASNEQNEKILGAVSGVVGAIGQTMQIFQQAKKGQETSVLGTTLAFAAAGAAIGGWIGALVGAVAGLSIALIANAKARKEQPYAAYGIENGVAYVEAFAGKEKNFANVTNAMMNDMLSQMTKTLESTRNDYVKLLMKFPEGIADSITAANFAPSMDQYKEKGLGFMHWLVRTIFPLEATVASFTSNKYRGNVQHLVTEEGDIGNPLWDKNAQKNFMADFQNWVDNTLPKAIIASFEEPLMRGFETLGLSAGKFHQIWDRLQAIDPKEAIKSLNELYDALYAFKGAEEFLNQRLYGGAGFEFNTPGALGQGGIDNNKPFQDALAQADAGIVALGATIEQLIGPDQITAAKQFGDALTQREAAVKQFFQQVAAAIDSVIKDYQSSIRDLELQGMVDKEGKPDVGAQVAYLKKYADQLYQQIQNAPNIETATALSAELKATILRIQQIGGAQSEEAAEAYRLWALEQLRSAQSLVVTRLQELAQAVVDQNQALWNAIEGFIDAFKAATEAVTAITNGEPEGNQTNENPTPYNVRADGGQGGEGYFVAKPWERPFFERGRNFEMPPPPMLAPPPPAENVLFFRANEQAVSELRETNRRLGVLEEIFRTGRDYRVSTRVIIEGEGPPVEVDTTGDDGHLRRIAAERGR